MPAILKKCAVLLSSGFGLGHSPFAPGTVGTLLGIPIVWAFHASGIPLAAQVGIAAVLCLLAVPICTAGERAAGTKDPHSVVADEYLTFPLCMLGLPFTPLALAIAFVTNRVLDIVKPFPARQLQALPAGWGITLDDVFSALYSLLLNHAIWQVLLHLRLA